MATTKPISTISYNSREYLEKVLKNLVTMGKISEWMFIKHQPEEDETKEHFHVWVKPACRIDVNSLRDSFKELDWRNINGKPLGVMPFRASKIDDWVLYCLHDEAYLRSKLEERRYHYSRDDIIACDEDWRNDVYKHAMNSSDFAMRRKKNKLICDAIESHQAYQLLRQGDIALGQCTALNAACRLFREENDSRYKN